MSEEASRWLLDQGIVNLCNDAFSIDNPTNARYPNHQAFARRLVADEPACADVNVTSQSGLVALDLRAAYCSSKAGVVNLTRELAFEWAKHSIRVNAVAPTFVLTPLSRPMLEDETFRAHVRGMIPMGRLPEISEVSDAVLFLASPASSFVTGHTLVVDGGWTIH